jgi:SAM-dependent methyltransferase
MIRRAIAKVIAAGESGWHSLGRLPVIRTWRARHLRRLHPLADGRQRGTPVIRYYWDRFLDRHRADIRGHALEIGATLSLQRLGGPAVTRADALDLAARDGITIVADISRADALHADTYDCIVVPFTMHLIYDLDAAMHHLVRILKPGGVLLVNFPCVDYYFPRGLDMGTGAALFVHWWFTPLQVQNLLRRQGLDDGNFVLVSDGNLFARVAYQMNLPVEELGAEERDFRDEGHPLVIGARVVKPEGWAAARPEYRDPWLPAGPPEPWHPVTGHYPRR